MRRAVAVTITNKKGTTWWNKLDAMAVADRDALLLQQKGLLHLSPPELQGKIDFATPVLLHPESAELHMYSSSVVLLLHLTMDAHARPPL